MKQLFIIILLSISFALFGQRENMLPIKSNSLSTDTIRVVKDNQSSLMLRSVLQGAVYDSISTHTDTLQALRADIVAGGSSQLMDSIAAHRIVLDNHTDSIASHRTVLGNYTDSIAVHRTELNNAADSIAAHRTEINANTTTGATNGTNISSNSVFILDNSNDITSLEDSIAKHTDTLQVHQGQIAALQSTAGDVTKVGTPVNNQVGVWTGDGTLEGTTDFTYDATALNVGIPSAAPLIQIKGSSTPGYTIYSNGYASTWIETFSNSATTTHLNYNERGGGTYAAQAAAPTDAIVTRHQYNVHDGTSSVKAGEFKFQVDGAIAAGNFNTKYTWDLKEGTSASTEKMSLDNSGLNISDGLNITTLANDNAETNLLAYDTGTGLVAYRSVASIGGSSDSSWTSITVDTITEYTTSHGVLIEGVLNEDYHVTVPSGTGRFSFGDGDTYFIENADDQLALNVGGGNSMLMTTSSIFMYKNIVPYPTTKTLDIGSATYFWDDVFMDRAYIDTTANYLDIDVSNNMTFTDVVTGTKTLAELAAAGTEWTKTGTNLSPTTGGDDILLATGGVERLGWGDGDTQLYESSDDVLDIIVGGSSNWQMTSSANNSFRNFLPSVTNSLDLGTSSYYWNNLFIDDIFIDDATTTIGKDVSNNMVLTDAVTGTKTLAELAASANSYSGALTDGSPTAAQINTATSLTPSTAGAGFSCIIKDTDGSALGYNVWSDGTNWYYVALTTAT